MFGLFNFAQEHGRTVDCNMGEVRPVVFTGEVNSLGTQDLRGCSVALVASRRAAIMAHIQALGDEYVASKMDDLVSKFRRLQHPFFANSNEIWVVFAMFDMNGNIENLLEDQVAIVKQKLTIAGLSPREAVYIFGNRPAADSPTYPGKGTVFIDAANEDLKIYVEDCLVN